MVKATVTAMQIVREMLFVKQTIVIETDFPNIRNKTIAALETGMFKATSEHGWKTADEFDYCPGNCPLELDPFVFV